MTTDDFSILSLSPEIFEDRISEEKFLNLDEVFEYLQCPEVNQKSNVDTTTLPQVPIDVALTSRPTFIIRSPILSTIWKFYGKRNPKRLKYSEMETKSLRIPDSDSGFIQILPLPDHWLKMVIGFYDSIKDVILLAKHLLELLNASIYRLEIESQYLDNLETILSIQKFKRAKEVIIQPGTVSHEEMRRVLEDFEPVSLSVCCSPEPGFEFDGTLSQCYVREEQEGYHEYASIRLKNNTSWFRHTMLQTIVCREFILETRSITNDDVNKFLHYWFNGTTTDPITISIVKPRFRNDNESEEKTQYYDDYSWNDDENWDREKFELEKITQGLERLILEKQYDWGLILRRETDGLILDLRAFDTEADTECHLLSSFEYVQVE